MIKKCNNFRKRKILESVCIEKYSNFNVSEGLFKLDPLMSTLVVKALPEVVINHTGEVRSGPGVS